MKRFLLDAGFESQYNQMVQGGYNCLEDLREEWQNKEEQDEFMNEFLKFSSRKMKKDFKRLVSNSFQSKRSENIKVVEEVKRVANNVPSTQEQPKAMEMVVERQQVGHHCASAYGQEQQKAMKVVAERQQVGHHSASAYRQENENRTKDTLIVICNQNYEEGSGFDEVSIGTSELKFMMQTFYAAGWDVIPLNNLTAAKIEQQLEEQCRLLQGCKNVMLYYMGHGALSTDGEQYLVGIKGYCISCATFLTSMHIQNSQRFMLVNACRTKLRPQDLKLLYNKDDYADLSGNHALDPLNKDKYTVWYTTEPGRKVIYKKGLRQLSPFTQVLKEEIDEIESNKYQGDLARLISAVVGSPSVGGQKVSKCEMELLFNHKTGNGTTTVRTVRAVTTTAEVKPTPTDLRKGNEYSNTLVYFWNQLPITKKPFTDPKTVEVGKRATFDDLRDIWWQDVGYKASATTELRNQLGEAKFDEDKIKAAMTRIKSLYGNIGMKQPNVWFAYNRCLTAKKYKQMAIDVLSAQKPTEEELMELMSISKVWLPKGMQTQMRQKLDDLKLEKAKSLSRKRAESE